MTGRLEKELRALRALEIKDDVIEMALRLQQRLEGPFLMIMYQYGLITIEELDLVFDQLFAE
jgi:hypothetical protein